MFNFEKDVSQFQQKILMTKLNICAQETRSFDDELAYLNVCIKTFVGALKDYDNWYVSQLSESDLKDLLSLIEDPAVLFFILKGQLNLHWIFGHSPSLPDEDPAIRQRMQQYNAPWGRATTQQLAFLLSHEALKRFVSSGALSFEDIRAWDKTHEMGIGFAYDVLTFLINHADQVFALLDQNKMSILSLHEYFLEHHEQGFTGLLDADLLRT